MCKLFFNKFGTFLAIIFSNICSAPFSPLPLGLTLYIFWDTWCCPAGLLIFVLFFFISFCSLGLVSLDSFFPPCVWAIFSYFSVCFILFCWKLGISNIIMWHLQKSDSPPSQGLLLILNVIVDCLVTSDLILYSLYVCCGHVWPVKSLLLG